MTKHDADTVESDAPCLNLREVDRAEFTTRLVVKTHATALRGAVAFQLLVRPLANGGAVIYLEDGPNTFLRYEDKSRQFGLSGSHLWTIDAEVALDRCERMFDWLASVVWACVVNGEQLEARDGIFLNRWVGLRTRPHHLSLEEAERLFGEAPRVTARAGCASIEWEAPDRLLGANADYQRRKEAAEHIFELMSLDAAERYAGAVNAAFLRTWCPREKDHEPKV